MNPSSANHFTLYGSQPLPSAGTHSGMGSLQNLARGVGGSNVNLAAQLSRAAPGNQGSQVGIWGGRLTPTSGVSSNAFSGSSAYPSANVMFPSSQMPTSNRLSTYGMTLLQSSSASGGSLINSLSSVGFSSFTTGSPGRIINRDRGGKMDSLFSPNTFDPSEFPSLGNRENSAPNPVLSARSNYVGMVKQPTMETSEFTMSHEDFPALPGAPAMASSGEGNSNRVLESNAIDANFNKVASGVGLHDQVSQMSSGIATVQRGAAGSSIVASASGDNTSNALPQLQQQERSVRRGIQTSPEGRVTNIPPSMVTDQFGMIGLLTFIRAAETDPNLVSLALGADLTTLGLNLNSEVNLYPTFAGPWAETPCRPQDIDYHVPFEYLTNTSIRDKLAPVKLNRYKDDVLFYMFYTNVGDVLQLAAATELYNRDWRYHKEERVWITRAPGMAPSEKSTTYERGTYYFFDVSSWRKVSKEFHLDYDKLEDRPNLPSNLSSTGAATHHQQLSTNSQQTPSSSSPVPPGIPLGVSSVMLQGGSSSSGVSHTLSSVGGSVL